MSSRARRISIALVVLAVLGIGYQYWMSDRARLNRRLTELQELLTKEAAEENLVSAGRARQVTQMLAPGFILLATPYEEATVTDPNQVLQGVVRLRQAGESVDVDISRRDLVIQPGNRTGTISFLATVTVDFGDRRAREAYSVRSLWVEDGGRWLLREAEVIERVEGTDGLGIW